MRTRVLTLLGAATLLGVLIEAQGAPTLQPAAPVGRDLKTTLFQAANAMGMLRGLQQEDSITTFEFWATGTLNEGGQSLKLSAYRASVRFRTVPGMRVDFTSASPGQPPRRRIQVVAGKLAWNETEPGLNATPAPEAAGDRFLQFAALPQAVVKGAMAAGDKAAVAFAGGRSTLTFPIDGVSAATLSATLDGKHLIERVVIRSGEVVTETTYSGYADLNERDYKADILFPRRIVQKRGGTTVLDLTVVKTNTYNPYVIMPVPDNVEKSGGGTP